MNSLERIRYLKSNSDPADKVEKFCCANSAVNQIFGRLHLTEQKNKIKLLMIALNLPKKSARNSVFIFLKSLAINNNKRL